MFSCPYYNQYPPIYRVLVRPSYVRVLHAVPDAPHVDVYVNNRKVVTNLGYRGFTQYLPLSSGLYNIKVYPAGQIMNPVINTSVQIPEGQIFTLAAIGRLANIRLLPILDSFKPLRPGRTYVRFSHLSPNAPNVDVVLPDGKKLFRDIKFTGITDYVEIKPGTHTLNLNAANTNNRVLHIPNINFKPNRFYTVYAVGLAGENPPLQALVPLDGQSYIKI